jgi:hypothetical protein
MPDELVESYLADSRGEKMEPIPDYALDCHTVAGKRKGKTKDQFFQDEHAALRPRTPGLFDDDVEKAGAK